MKKLLLILTGLYCFLPAAAQNGLSVNAGISIPLMCYKAKDADNPNSGFAATGLHIDISYTHAFNRVAGFRSMLYYAGNPAGNFRVPSYGAYRMAGCMIGPLVTGTINERWSAGFGPLAGYSRVWTPALRRENQPWLYQQATGCFSWGAVTDFNYRINEKNRLHFSTSHLNMKPALKVYGNESAKTEQHIVLLNVKAGISRTW